MELVAASKMRRAQLNALAARPYAERLRWVLADLAETLPQIDPADRHPLLQVREEIRSLDLILVTPNRGLSGALPGNLVRRAAQFIMEREGTPVRVCAVGRKGRDFMRRTGQEIVAEFTELGDYPSYEETRPISQVVIDDFITGAADEAFIIYAEFVNIMTQQPQVRRLLPIEPPTDVEAEAIDYIYEPGRAEVLEELLPRYLEREVFDAILEAGASEQSARMVAMRNATDYSFELVEDLTLEYNKARQESITNELLDIVGGVEALA